MLTGVHLHKSFHGLSKSELTLEKFELLSSIFCDTNLFCQVSRVALDNKQAKDLLKQHFYRDQVEDSFLYHSICAFAAYNKTNKALLLVD